MNFRPLHDRVMIQRLDEGEQRIGGIIIPDSATEKPQRGKVRAVGNGKVNEDGKRVPLDVRPGDLILFGKYSGQDITLEGQEYLIMKEEDVLAVLGSATGKTPAGVKGKAEKIQVGRKGKTPKKTSKKTSKKAPRKTPKKPKTNKKTKPKKR